MKINIMRAGLRGEKPWTEQIDAEPIGDVFAIHPTPPADLSDDFYNLTHVPTGYAFLSGVTEANARAAAQEILASGLDWAAVTTPKKLTAEHKRARKAIREKYGDRAW